MKKTAIETPFEMLGGFKIRIYECGLSVKADSIYREQIEFIEEFFKVGLVNIEVETWHDIMDQYGENDHSYLLLDFKTEDSGN